MNFGRCTIGLSLIAITAFAAYISALIVPVVIREVVPVVVEAVLEVVL